VATGTATADVGKVSETFAVLAETRRRGEGNSRRPGMVIPMSCSTLWLEDSRCKVNSGKKPGKQADRLQGAAPAARLLANHELITAMDIQLVKRRACGQGAGHPVPGDDDGVAPPELHFLQAGLIGRTAGDHDNLRDRDVGRHIEEARTVDGAGHGHPDQRHGVDLGIADVLRNLPGHEILQLRAQQAVERELGDIGKLEHLAGAHRERIRKGAFLDHGQGDQIAGVEIAAFEPVLDGHALVARGTLQHALQLGARRHGPRAELHLGRVLRCQPERRGGGDKGSDQAGNREAHGCPYPVKEKSASRMVGP
jgi:hypothetical protein